MTQAQFYNQLIAQMRDLNTNIQIGNSTLQKILIKQTELANIEQTKLQRRTQ